MNKLVPVSSIITMSITCILTLVIPILLMALWKIKGTGKIKTMLIGMVTFIIAVFVLEQLAHFLMIGWDNPFSAFLFQHTLAYALYGGLMAGVFEETARYFVFSKILRKKGDKGTPISYGLGHGGIECIVLVGVTYIGNIVYSLLINSGQINTMIEALPEESRKLFISALDPLVTTASSTFLLAGWERMAALLLQVGFSILVFIAVRQTKKRWFFPLAIFLHAMIDVLAVLAQKGEISLIVLEIVVTAYAIGVFWFGFAQWKQIKEEESIESVSD